LPMPRSNTQTIEPLTLPLLLTNFW